MVKSNKSFAKRQSKPKKPVIPLIDQFIKAAENPIVCNCGATNCCPFRKIVVPMSILEFLRDKSKDSCQELFAKHDEPYVLRYKEEYYWIFDGDREDDSYYSNPSWVAVKTTREGLICALRDGFGVYWNDTPEIKKFDEVYEVEVC